MYVALMVAGSLHVAAGSLHGRVATSEPAHFFDVCAMHFLQLHGASVSRRAWHLWADTLAAGIWAMGRWLAVSVPA